MDEFSIKDRFACATCALFFYGKKVEYCPKCGKKTEWICKADKFFREDFEYEEDVASIIIRKTVPVHQEKLFKEVPSFNFKVNTL